MPLTTYTTGEVLTAASLNANFTFAATNPVSKIAQVVTADKTDVFTTTSTSYIDVTGWTASITPTLNTSKILIMYSTSTSASGGTYTGFQILRGATAVGNGVPSGSQTAANKGQYDSLDGGGMSMMGHYIDSPATTSATTYQIQVKNHSANTLTVGATQKNVNTSVTSSVLTNITLIEVLA